MHHLRGIHFSIIHVPTSLYVYQCLISGYWQHFFFIQILDIYNCIVSYIGISTKFQLIMIQQNQKCFLKGVLYATVKTSLVSKFGKHIVIDQNPNNIDLSTKNKVHASLVLLSNQKITCMQALVQSCRQTLRKRETLWLHFTKELNMIKS